MNLEDSIYIKCLKKGFNAPPEGISFNEMIQYLVAEGHPEANTHDFKCHFYVWFFDNFFQHAIYYDRMMQRQPPMWPWAYRETVENGKPNPQLEVKSPMMFPAQESYLNYLSLEATKSKSTLAVRIALAAMILSTLLGGMQCHYAKQSLESSANECKPDAANKPRISVPPCKQLQLLPIAQKDNSLRLHTHDSTK